MAVPTGVEDPPPSYSVTPCGSAQSSAVSASGAQVTSKNSPEDGAMDTVPVTSIPTTIRLLCRQIQHLLISPFIQHRECQPESHKQEKNDSNQVATTHPLPQVLSRPQSPAIFGSTKPNRLLPGLVKAEKRGFDEAFDKAPNTPDDNEVRETTPTIDRPIRPLLSIGGRSRRGFQNNNPASQPREFIIAENGDHTIRLYDPRQRFTRFNSASGKDIGGAIIATFRVNSEVLMKQSMFFMEEFTKLQLCPMSDIKATARPSDDSLPSIPAWNVWFRQLHGNLTEENGTADVNDVRHLMCIAWQYNLPINSLNNWFKAWMLGKGGPNFSRFTYEDCNKLLCPCERFDFAEGFAHTTKVMAYDTRSHFHETTPMAIRSIHLSFGMIAAINAARGSLRRMFFERVYQHDRFRESSCECRKDGLMAYEEALHSTGAWPLERVLNGRDKISINDLLDRFRSFTYTKPNEECDLCSQDFLNTVIIPAIDYVANYFDGLCLDCVDKYKTRNWDNDYFGHHYNRPAWDEDCRIDHGQPSAWFSYLARPHREGRFEKSRMSEEERDDDLDDDAPSVVSNKRQRMSDT